MPQSCRGVPVRIQGAAGLIMAKVTMYQIEKREYDGHWAPVGNPFDSMLLADLARLEWLPDDTTRVDPIAVEVP